MNIELIVGKVIIIAIVGIGLYAFFYISGLD